VAPAIVAHIHNEAVAIVVAQEMAVKFGEAARQHFGNVNVARAAACRLANIIAVAFHPVAITSLRFRSKRAHTHPPVAASSLHRQIYLGPGLMHERLMRGHCGGEPLSIHRSNEVPGFKLRARRAKRTGFIRVPGIAAQETVDAIAAGRVIPGEIRAQEPNGVARRLAVSPPMS